MRGGGINRALHREHAIHAKELEKEREALLKKHKKASHLQDSPDGGDAGESEGRKRVHAPERGVASALRRRSSTPPPPAAMMKRASTHEAAATVSTASAVDDADLDGLPTTADLFRPPTSTSADRTPLLFKDPWLTNVEHLGVAAAREPLLIQLNNFALLGTLLTGVSIALLMGGIPSAEGGEDVSEELRDWIGLAVEMSLLLALLATILSTMLLEQLNVRVMDHEFLGFMKEFGYLGTVTRFSLILCCPCIGLTCVLLAYACFSPHVAKTVATSFGLVGVFLLVTYTRVAHDQMRVVRKLHVHNKMSGTVERIMAAREEHEEEERERKFAASAKHLFGETVPPLAIPPSGAGGGCSPDTEGGDTYALDSGACSVPHSQRSLRKGPEWLDPPNLSAREAAALAARRVRDYARRSRPASSAGRGNASVSQPLMTPRGCTSVKGSCAGATALSHWQTMEAACAAVQMICAASPRINDAVAASRSSPTTLPMHIDEGTVSPATSSPSPTPTVEAHAADGSAHTPRQLHEESSVLDKGAAHRPALSDEPPPTAAKAGQATKGRLSVWPLSAGRMVRSPPAPLSSGTSLSAATTVPFDEYAANVRKMPATQSNRLEEWGWPERTISQR